jgi:hypothetical protein
VILTGLGLGLIATWLSTKPEVTKITVLENNIYLINYFKKYGFIDPIKLKLFILMPKLILVNANVLLCNHWINVIDLSTKIY